MNTRAANNVSLSKPIWYKSGGKKTATRLEKNSWGSARRLRNGITDASEIAS